MNKMLLESIFTYAYYMKFHKDRTNDKNFFPNGIRSSKIQHLVN